MMTTLGAILLDGRDPEEIAERLERAHDGWTGLGSRLAGPLQPLLNIPLGNLALSAYGAHRRLRMAKEKTRRQPNSREVVQLARHELVTNLHPEFEVDVNGIPGPVMKLDLELKLRIEALTAVVENGRLVAGRPGSTTASAALKAGKRTLIEGTTKPVRLGKLRESGVTIDLDSPIWDDKTRTLDL